MSKFLYSLTIYLIFGSVYVLAGTPQIISNIYNAQKKSKNINMYQQGISSPWLSPSPSAGYLAEAAERSRRSMMLNSKESELLNKYNNALSVEMFYLLRSIDAQIKLETIKFLYCDLLSASIQQNILNSTALSYSAQEDMSGSLEKEFKGIGLGQ